MCLECQLHWNYSMSLGLGPVITSIFISLLLSLKSHGYYYAHQAVLKKHERSSIVVGQEGPVFCQQLAEHICLFFHFSGMRCTCSLRSSHVTCVVDNGELNRSPGSRASSLEIAASMMFVNSSRLHTETDIHTKTVTVGNCNFEVNLIDTDILKDFFCGDYHTNMSLMPQTNTHLCMHRHKHACCTVEIGFNQCQDLQKPLS